MHQWLSSSVKERKDFAGSLSCMCGARDHLDVFPQLIANNASTILHIELSHTLTSSCISYTPHAVILVIASHPVHLLASTINRCTYKPVCQYIASHIVCVIKIVCPGIR